MKLIDMAIKVLERQPCEDAISREAVIEKATEWESHFTDSERYISLSDIMSLPPLTPQPKKGEWIGGSMCSRCNYKKMPLWQYNYCPICGSKNGENEEDKEC